MVICGMKRIDANGGRYIVLVDNGTEGLSVSGQFEEIEHALQHLSEGSPCGSACALVELTCFNVQHPEYEE